MPLTLDFAFEYDDQPIIPVLITADNSQVGVSALIDTGAEITVLDARIADQLGLNLDSLPRARISGIGGGSWDIRLADVALAALFEPELEVSIRVGFTYAIAESFPNVLCRDLWKHLDLGLSRSTRTVSLGRARIDG